MATFAVMGFLNGPYSWKMDDESEACFVNLYGNLSFIIPYISL